MTAAFPINYGENCKTDVNNCVVCPPLYTKGGTLNDANVGWWGGNSLEELDGDMHAVFTMVVESSVLVGFRSDRKTSNDPTQLEHAMGYFSRIDGLDVYTYHPDHPYGGVDTTVQHLFFDYSYVGIMEGGTVVFTYPWNGNTNQYSAAPFEIRRINGIVLYFVDGEIIYMSRKPSVGTKIVNGMIYGGLGASYNGGGFIA